MDWTGGQGEIPFGQIRVEWDAFDRVEFRPPPTVLDPSALDPSVLGRSGRLRGTVRARGGESHTGWIRWDNDEECGWELPDGRLMDGVDLDIELGPVHSVERGDGTLVVVPWDRFESVI